MTEVIKKEMIEHYFQSLRGTFYWLAAQEKTLSFEVFSFDQNKHFSNNKMYSRILQKIFTSFKIFLNFPYISFFIFSLCIGIKFVKVKCLVLE